MTFAREIQSISLKYGYGGEGMEKQPIIVSIIVFLVCIGLNGCLGIGFLIFDGIIWFTARNLYEATHKTT
jgi:hypothetical protein